MTKQVASVKDEPKLGGSEKALDLAYGGQQAGALVVIKGLKSARRAPVGFMQDVSLPLKCRRRTRVLKCVQPQQPSL